MARLNRFQLMERNKDRIADTFQIMGSGFFSFPEIAVFVEENKPDWSLPNKTSVNEVLKFLTEQQILKELSIKLPHRSTTRYIWGSPSVYEIALSLNKNSYITHFSALLLHGLTGNVTKSIYTNVEQANKWSSSYDDDEMEQKDIDLAFSRPMRKTNQIAIFELDGTKYQVYMLNGKNHGHLGIKNYSFNNIELSATDVERTLVDIVVRPNYAGGVEEVLDAFIAAKGQFSVNKMVAYLKKMNYKYPYHQLIGFYLEKAGYQEDVLRLLENIEIKYNFYLTYQMKEKDFSKRWRVYYPKSFAQ